MRSDIRFESDAPIAVFADADNLAELSTRGAAEAESLRGRCQAGEAFVAEAEEPSMNQFRLFVDEPVPEEIEEASGSRSGSFLLRLPSGRLRVTALGPQSAKTQEPPEVHTVDVPPGDYSLTLLDGITRDAQADAARIDADDWRIYERVNHFGASGCLFLALGGVFVLIPYTRHEYWYLLPLFLLPTCAFILLRNLPGYARVSKQVREDEAALPQYAVSMRRLESTEGLEGGWYQCK